MNSIQFHLVFFFFSTKTEKNRKETYACMTDVTQCLNEDNLSIFFLSAKKDVNNVQRIRSRTITIVQVALYADYFFLSIVMFIYETMFSSFLFHLRNLLICNLRGRRVLANNCAQFFLCFSCVYKTIQHVIFNCLLFSLST